MNTRLQLLVEPVSLSGVAPHAIDEIILAPDDPRFRPSDAAWMMVGGATPHVWVRHADGRNPFVVMKASLAESDPETFTRLLSVAAAIGFKVHVCADFLSCETRASRQLQELLATEPRVA